ncbi:MAG: decarboxylating NADP(+)-dependent phosphogluconate dehydrogenase [Gammaproteobacteria bacterium]|nr:decarboxylating NADP(+)-dependent phosphogluconate dehydrogenase [Gammaproteobacteria bacterium]MBU1653808.1 decarboxylating NADP(+)-dependent phosphogluconate dehydrogenase [Gammaproteobacteria bacterium]MBU1961720.1 decarboxylating NADP(+)-dependent phosphogluconate dehydrogenase [Gammaproteobacteria bacterium]
MEKADIGLIGLAVMGQNLVLNMNDRGHRVAVYNRSQTRLDEFLAGPAKGAGIAGAHSIAELVGLLQTPRKLMLMVRSGEAVDELIGQLLPLLERGDLIIDGGNSLFRDTSRRVKALAEQGILYLGVGISGGEEGARQGPSIMPGGNPAAWPLVKGLFQSIAAQVDGEPCCHWVGEEGAGHYVKMVHNGIEYGDMQLICEAYDLMLRGLGMPVERIQTVFEDWNRGVLDSYLIGITAEILERREDGEPLVDKILDSAGQKGTGKWTAIDALEQGVPLTLIGEAVQARFLSAMKEERQRAARRLPASVLSFDGDLDAAVRQLHDALYASKIISYAQGYMLMRQAAGAYGWNLQYGDIALMWRGGCIIRSRFLNHIKAAFERNPGLENLLLDGFFAAEIAHSLEGWRGAVMRGIGRGIPLPAMASALSFYDGYRSSRLPANLLQAQRDYFGAHGYERIDRPRGESFHSQW